jgi:hypothetical protein
MSAWDFRSKVGMVKFSHAMRNYVWYTLLPEHLPTPLSVANQIAVFVTAMDTIDFLS